MAYGVWINIGIIQVHHEGHMGRIYLVLGTISKLCHSVPTFAWLLPCQGSNPRTV